MTYLFQFKSVAKSLLLACAFALYIPAARSLANDEPDTTEMWLVTTVRWGNPMYHTMTLDISGKTLNGNLDGEKLVGTRINSTIEFLVRDNNTVHSYKGNIEGNSISGTSYTIDTDNAQDRVLHNFTARLIPRKPPGPARLHEFKPTDYSNTFDPHRLPVLTIWPGDTVRTATLDSGGVDENGKTKALFGNPQVGPFFIATAEPGDTLAVKLNRVRTNRDYADSLDSIVGRALGANFASQAGELGNPVRWKLDRVKNVATLEKPSDKLKNISLPMRPMLGGLAVAPGNGMPAISTGDTGRFGGNMDSPDVIEGNTVYLNVQQPGALLYIGDGHALQGDGETSQYGLETSLAVEFTVDVIKGKAISAPRIESPTQLITLGQAGSLDDALKSATSALVQWLQQDYDLSLSECGIILGSSVRYSVPNLAGRNVGVAAKLDKSVLSGIPRKN
ncbi:MAG: acetamidase/formamidase family protein [Rhodanobacteraceae bacterium]|nr:acetamidase/formamidase family protein [Rhodanobacteraceae bacterium]